MQRNLHNESDIHDAIQSPALKAVKTFEDILRRDSLRSILTPDQGARLVESHLWRRGKASVYKLLADSIVNAIQQWKHTRHEAPASLITVWLRYDSLLYHDHWTGVRPVAVRRGETYEAYHWPRKGTRAPETDLETGPVELWFPLLTRPLDTGRSTVPFPTIHDYLSKFHPSHTSGPKRLITGITFCSMDPTAFPDPELEERRILARSGSARSHLYIPFAAPTVEEIHKQLCVLVDPKEITISTGRYARRIRVRLQDDALAQQWLHRYGFWLRNVVMRQRSERRTRAVPLLDESCITGPEREQAEQIFADETELFGPSSSGWPARRWTSRYYNSMTNIRVYVPEAGEDLGSVAILSDKVLGEPLVNLIGAAVWPVFSHLRQVEQSVISQANLKKHALRSAIAAIMARNMSHNTGSHGLAHLIGDTIRPAPEEEGQEKAFLRYLKGRMDFVAEITTYWRELPWSGR